LGRKAFSAPFPAGGGEKKRRKVDIFRGGKKRGKNFLLLSPGKRLKERKSRAGMLFECQEREKEGLSGRGRGLLITRTEKRSIRGKGLFIGRRDYDFDRRGKKSNR